MPDVEHSILLGIAATAVAVLGYGSVFVPIKRFEARDGVFVALCMSIGQVAPCLITSAAYGTASVHPIAMVAGVLYGIGNSFSVVIMDSVGMAVGSLLWNITACIWGWAVARFGLFGIIAIPPANNIMNIIGVATICIGGMIFSLVRSVHINTRPAPFHALHESVSHVKLGKPFRIHWKKPEKHEVKTNRSHVIGAVLALAVGSLYGNLETPANIMVERAKLNYTNERERPSAHQGAHSFSYAIGSLFTSTIIFVGYSLYRKNKPFINTEITCPALFSGVIYGIATSASFVALENLDQVIAMPMITILPGIVVSMWSILLFHEIRRNHTENACNGNSKLTNESMKLSFVNMGHRNLITLAIAYAVTVIGVVLIAVSKIS